MDFTFLKHHYEADMIFSEMYQQLQLFSGWIVIIIFPWIFMGGIISCLLAV